MSNKKLKNVDSLARGKRLRFVRTMAGMTIEVFATRCGIGRSTVFCWEKGLNPLSQRGAQKIVRAMQDEGLSCTVEWLMEGAGEWAKIADQTKLSRLNYALASVPISELQVREALPGQQASSLPKEIALFKKLHVMHLIGVIQDEEMSPVFYPGDWVGGIILTQHEIRVAHEKNCIIRLKEGETFVRRVQIENTQADKLSFYVVNAQYSLKYPPIYQLPLEAVVAIAPVIRIWREQTEGTSVD